MTFSVGDRVRILVEFIPGTRLSIPPETIATIEMANEDKDDFRLQYQVGGYQSWYFSSGDFEPANIYHSMVAPEFDLEDMELAEIIMEEMK